MTMKPDFSKPFVLYADDDFDDLILVKEAFERFSRKVDMVTVYDGVEAVSFLKNLSPKDPSPCLIILDLNMPRMNGKEALKEIRTIDRFKNIPVVFFTTSSFQEDKDYAKKFKAGFVSKPLSSRQFEGIADHFIKFCNDDVMESLRSDVGIV